MKDFYPRLIPVVTLIGEKAVKTKKFSNPIYVGDPVNTTNLFSSFEVEELVILDISESYESERVSNQLLREILQSAFMPIAFGGGIKDIGRASELFSLGFDKVILRSSLLSGNLSRQISEEYGAQAVSGCIDVRYESHKPDHVEINGNWFTDSEAKKLVTEIENTGIGELIIHDVEFEGSLSGLRNHKFLELAINNLSIPVVPLGGCKNSIDASQFLHKSKCHSIAASTTFLFHHTRNAVLVNYPTIDNWHKLLENEE